MKKKTKAENKRPIDSYLDKYFMGTGDMGSADKKGAGGGQGFDMSSINQMSSDFLMSAAASSVSSLLETAMGKNPHPKIFDFTANKNPVMAYGGTQGQPNAEVEGEEVFETPNGQMGKFKGASHEQGGIEVELPEQTKIFSKRLEKAGKSMAERKVAREKSIASIEKQLKAQPNDKILKQTLERVKETNSIEEQGDMMIQESMNAMSQAKSLGTYLAKYGGTLPKYWGGGTTDPTKLFGEEITPAAYQDNSYTTFDDIYKNQFGSNTLALQKTLGKYQAANPGITYNYGGNDGVLGNMTKGFFDDAARVKDFQNYLTQATAGTVNNAKQFNSNDLSSPFQNALQFENQPSMKIGTEQGTPDPVNFEMYQYLKDNNMTQEQLGSMFNNIRNSNLVDKSGNTIPYPDPVSYPDGSTDITKSSTPVSDSTFKNPMEGYDFTIGDKMGILGTKISGLAPLATTLANRMGDTPNINAYLNYGKEGLNTLESTKGMLGINKANLMAQLGLQKTTTDKQARNSARSVNTLRGLNELSNAREQDMTADVYSDYSKQMMGVLNQVAQAQTQRDGVVMRGEEGRDLADRQDRDNFFTELNKDFVNYGTSVQKIAKDLNVKEGDKDFLDLLPQMSKYGLGMRKDDNGKWEIYHADSGKKATADEVEKAKNQASTGTLTQTYDFSSKKKLGKNSKKQKVGEFTFDYNFE